MDYSLMFPQNAERSFKTLTPESVNDLSIEFILDALTKQRYERDHIRKIMTRITDDPEVIRTAATFLRNSCAFPSCAPRWRSLL